MKRLLCVLLLLLPAAAWAAERPLVVDKARSRVDVVVKATVDSFTGSLADYDAKLVIDDATGRIMATEVRFNFLDVKTGKDKRDAKMHVWQDTPKHPTGAFVLRELETTPEGGRIARGHLEFHGVRRELVFPVVVTRDQRLYAIDGEAVIDTRDYGLPVIRMMALLKVDPLVRVRFHLQAELANP
ncbi:MAG: hypothetical protein RIS54_1513 [Verrucomicrobiota bacterium]|jgi:polyisoprenoid-binding protein YceI